MEEEKVFFEKETMPDEEMINEAIGSNYTHLQAIRQFIAEEIGDTNEEWKFYGKKLGWTLKKFYKKRNLFFIGIYKGYFKISFVFGERAAQNVYDSGISSALKKELSEARQYAEGRGISINVDNDGYLDDIKELVRIKVRN
ncbi:MAG: DUF3788 domain-containing protein [Bacteroidales bacterium]|nr:DUF3788 domain-containing protein [Bacteroidales bacterium]